MSSTGKLDRRRRGIGSIIGAIFVALILLSGFTFYTITADVTNHYDKTKESMSEMDWNHNREKLTIKRLEITVATNLNVTAKNEGAVQSHLIWLGIFNKTVTPEDQDYQALNEYIEPGETKSLISSFTIIEGKKYVVQLVTELGNTIMSTFFPASDVSCSLMLMTAPPTVYKGNNVTAWLTVTPNDTEVDVVQDLVVTLSTAPTGLMQLMDNSSLTVSSLTRGTTTFFWWTYNATNSGTVTLNATYIHAPAGAYALSTAEIVNSTQQADQGRVKITGNNSTAQHNPSTWNPLGSTQLVSGSPANLASNDSSYAIFRSYYTGASTDISHPVDSNSSNVDGYANRGAHSNFTAMRYGPDATYDAFTEGFSAGATTAYYPSGYNLLGSTQYVSGSLSDLQSDNNVYMTFRSYGSGGVDNVTVQTLYAHNETITVGGSTYYLSKNSSADITGRTLSASASSTGRKLMGKFVYPLTGVTSIPASAWTTYYRAYTDYTSNTHSLRASGGYMRVGDGTPNWGSATGTISFWVKWNTIGGRPWGQYEDMETRFSGSNLVLDWGTSTYSLTSSTSFVSGRWYFIAIVWNENTDNLRLYVGDQNNAPTLDNQDINWIYTVSTLGVTQNNFLASKGGVEPLNGYGDDLRYWNTDRSLASIQNDYNKELTGSEANLRSYFKLNNNFADTGPAHNDGSGSGSYSFSSDVPFATTSSTVHGDVDVLIRTSSGSVRQTIATDVANSGNLGGSWSTLSGTYSWSNYTVMNQTDYLEIDYYMHVTSAWGGTAYLRIDDNTLALVDQTRAANVNFASPGAPSSYRLGVEFTGNSATVSWAQLVWAIDSMFTADNVTVTFQLYNYTAGAYSASGDGFITALIGTSNVTQTQTITANPAQFRDANGNWKMNVTGVKTTTSQFDWKADFVLYQAVASSYELDLEVQWTGVEYSQTNRWLCIYGGTMAAENLLVDAWNGASWSNLLAAVSSGWNNVSVSSYAVSPIFTIRFRDGNASDTSRDSWNIDAALLHLWTISDQYTAEVEFTGSSNLESWTKLVWFVDSCWDIDSVGVTIQFYNYTLGAYSSGGNGYFSYTSSPTPNTDESGSQTINAGSMQFRNSTGYWKAKIKGVKSTSIQFLMKIDWIEIQDTYISEGNTIPYNTWQSYTISATAANSGPAPFTYISIYANGTSVAFRNATDSLPISNPSWVRLDSNGAFQLELKSTNSSGEAFVLYVVFGSVVEEKTITQEAQ